MQHSTFGTYIQPVMFKEFRQRRQVHQHMIKIWKCDLSAEADQNTGDKPRIAGRGIYQSKSSAMISENQGLFQTKKKSGSANPEKKLGLFYKSEKKQGLQNQKFF